MDRPARDEYVERARRRARDLAAQILAGSVDVLEAAIEMHRLRSQVDVEDRDNDFDAFMVVVSETDALPIGPQREHWAEDALARKEPRMQEARTWAHSVVEDECRNIIARFGA